MEEDDEYEPTDSEDDYSKDEKLLLEDARNAMKKKEISSDEEVYGFDESESDVEEEEEEDEDENIDMGSDLEDEEKIIDERAWGKRKRSFYNTDFVDQDYDGIYQGEEAEAAELEEQEAKNIQRRLMEQLNDADFSINELIDVPESTDTTSKPEVIQSDLSKLTKRQKLDLFRKESPEFFVLTADFKEKMKEVCEFLPVLNYFKKNFKSQFTVLQFLETKLSIILNYCTNISYYLFLKTKKIPIRNHPVVKSLYKYKQLLQQIEEDDVKIVKPQVNKILEMINTGKKIELEKNISDKKTLKLLIKQQKQQKETEMMKEKEEENVAVDNDEEEEIENETPISNDKRAITYEMAKNKGLTPKRNKIQRNPRVKHRKKYEKAKIRRRGQVRMPRREIPVYGGEPTGIKIGLTKSIKLKY